MEGKGLLGLRHHRMGARGVCSTCHKLIYDVDNILVADYQKLGKFLKVIWTRRTPSKGLQKLLNPAKHVSTILGGQRIELRIVARSLEQGKKSGRAHRNK